MNTEQAKKRMGVEHRAALTPQPKPRSGGSAGFRDQHQYTRLVGQDPLVSHAVINPSRPKKGVK